IGPGDRHERDPGFTGDRPGEQSLSGSGRAEEEHALGDLRPHLAVPVGVLQEVLDLLQLLYRLVEASHVVEGDPRLVLRDELGLRLSELHHAVPAALHLHEDEDHEPDEQEPREESDEGLHEARWLRVGLEGGARVAEELGQLTLVAIGVGGGELETVRGKPGTVDPAVDLVTAGQQLDFLELAVLDLGDELGKPDLFGAGELIEPPLRHDGEQHYGEPVNEQGSNGPIHDHLEGRWPQAVMSWYGMTLPRGT